MGNQLCPANNKEIIENFKGIQKGDKSMSDLVSYLQEKGKKDDSGYLGVQYDSKGQIIHTSTMKFRPEGVLRALDLDSEPSGFQKILEKECHQQSQLEDEKVLDASLHLPDGWRYNGQTIRGIPEGEGQQFGPGGYFKGHFKNGLKNGEGEYHYLNSAIYRGQFKDNLMCGYGVIQFPNGDKFQGQFVDNVREGRGKYIPRQPNLDGLLYFEGEYRNDKKNGAGKMVFQNDEVHGVWRDGVYDYEFLQ